MRGGTKHEGSAERRKIALVMMVVVSLAALSAVGCKDLTASTTGPTDTSPMTLTSLDTLTTGPESTEMPTTSTAAVDAVSQEALDYAGELGGTSHKGEKLYFVIGASVKTEKQALILLEPAKAVGDMQSNFIVQLSDNFSGMTPGYWVIFEAYYAYPSEEDLLFCRRPFPDAYVKTATVLTDDPIPVR